MPNMHRKYFTDYKVLRRKADRSKMRSEFRILLTGVLLILIATDVRAANQFKVTNIICESLNKTWVVIKQCRLRAIRRDVSSVSINVLFLHPATQIDLNVALLKRANGYKPFLMNYTIDACQFMIRRSNPFVKIILSHIKPYSNINHTCPYHGAQIIDGWVPKSQAFDVPLPGGEYSLWLTFILHKSKTFFVKLFYNWVE